MPTPLMPRRILPVALVAAATALLLTGCEPGALAPSASPTSSDPGPLPSGTPTAPPSSEPSPDTPTGTALPTTPPVAGEIACADLLTADQLYEFSPNFAPAADAGALPGAVASIAQAGGTVCAYQHVTAGDRLLVAALQSGGGFSAPAFETSGDLGIAAATDGETAVAVASQYFGVAADAQPVLDQVLGNLG